MSDTMTPDLKVQRQMLEQKRDAFKAQGYDSYLEAQAAMVQDPGPDARSKKAHIDLIKELEAKSANAYTAARRMQALLDEMPDEEDKPDAD